jgi:hypothetical protein
VEQVVSPRNEHYVLVEFKWTEDEFIFNDGADDNRDYVASDPLGAAIDAYLSPRDGDTFVTLKSYTVAERNSDEEEAYLREVHLGE